MKKFIVKFSDVFLDAEQHMVIMNYIYINSLHFNKVIKIM